MDVVDLVYLDQVFEAHENQVGAQTCLSAEVRVLEHGEDLLDQRFEILIVLQNVHCF